MGRKNTQFNKKLISPAHHNKFYDMWEIFYLENNNFKVDNFILKSISL